LNYNNNKKKTDNAKDREEEEEEEEEEKGGKKQQQQQRKIITKEIKRGFSTRAIHFAQEPDPVYGSVVIPIHLTSTFAQEEPGKHKGYEYSRTGNPTRKVLEECLASLENARYGLAFSSGLAAETAVTCSTVKSGDHILCCDDVYGGTYRLFERVFRRNFNVDVDYTDFSNPRNNIEKSLKNNTKLVWIESPTNPLMKIIDIREAASIAHSVNAFLVVDNTFASPFIQNPIDLGADIVVHSTTKYIAGHSDIVGGSIMTSNEDLYERLKFLQNGIGAVPSPFDCWLVLRGVKTLSVRMERHSSNAQEVSYFLERHHRVKKVYYPGLENHTNHYLAKKQMRLFGGMLSFDLKEGGFRGAVEVIKRLNVFTLAESLGGVESLVDHPASMTHASIPREKRESIGITDSLLRLSVGIEDIEDIIDDLSRALK
jgi:cystathionine beta-lyase/cystathionine gamma-synthase